MVHREKLPANHKSTSIIDSVKAFCLIITQPPDTISLGLELQLDEQEDAPRAERQREKL
jgi:hypothetical protein